VLLTQFLVVTVGLGVLRQHLSAIANRESEAPARPQR